MKILHITDLHLTEPGPKLPAFWAGLKDLIGKVDAVIVSGDLTQEARTARHNYNEVSQFLTDEVMQVLTVKEKRRIIIVPGNHDVDWTAPIGKERPCDPTNEPALYSSYLQAPERSKQRYIHEGSPPSSVKALDLDPHCYGKRFENFRTFLLDFYGSSTPNSQFRFDEAGADWSAHIFENERVAICGFNSCAGNDAHWRGASLDFASIDNATKFIERNAKGFLPIAVWHHGLTAPRGMPDHLTMRELGQLAASKFRIGVHGHTHEDEMSDPYEALRRTFPVIATGSFAAGAKQRPGGVRNQASVLSIRPTYLRWQLFTRDQKAQWEAGSSRIYDLMPPASPPGISTYNECSRMTRRATVDNNGIATIEVLYDKLTVDGELILAAPEAALRNVSEPGSAKACLGPKESIRLPVTWSEMGGSRIRARLEAKGPRTFEQLSWSYEMGVKFSLDAGDASHRMKEHQFDASLEPDEDAWSHVLRIHTGELVLSIEWPQETLVSAQVLVQKRVQGSDRANLWETDLDATADSGAVVTTTAKRVDVVIPTPRPSYRYCIAYKLKGAPGALDANQSWLLGEVVRQTRHERQSIQTLAIDLSASIGEALALVLACQATDLPCWMMHLWDDSTRRLVPVLGDFPPRSLGAVFEYGAGMIGHAFRVAGPSLYARSSRTPSPRTGANLLYQLRREQEDRGLEHEWVTSFPVIIVPPADGVERPAPVGVLSFSAYLSEQESPTAARLRRAAGLALPKGGSHDEEELFDRLTWIVSETLWGALEKQPNALGTSARKVYQRWKEATASIAPEAATFGEHEHEHGPVTKTSTDI